MIAKSTTEELLSTLFNQGIKLWVENDHLKCSGSMTLLKGDLGVELQSRSEELKAFLAKLSTNQQSAKYSRIQKHSRVAPLALSFAQQRLWFLQELNPGTSANNIPFTLQIKGKLDTPALQTALDKVVGRHEILRTHFVSKSGDPLQYSHKKPILIANKVLDSISLAAGDETKAIQAISESQGNEPFDLSSDALLRLTTYRVHDRCHYLIITAHHIVADGWSLDILIRELTTFYREATENRPNALPPFDIQYGDYSVWQRQQIAGENLDSQLDYWVKKLDGVIPTTQFPTDFPRPPIQTGNGKLALFCLNAAQTEALKQLGNANGASLFATLFTLFHVILYRYTGQKDLVLGTPVANRHYPDTEHMIGLFVNPLITRCRILPNGDFADNLKLVQNEIWQTQKYQDIPFEKIVEQLQPQRDLSLHPFFQIKFQFDPPRSSTLSIPGLTFEQIPKQSTIAKLDLSLDMSETPNGIAAAFEYNKDLFATESIERLALHFKMLVDAVINNPTRSICELNLLSDNEKKRQLDIWNRTTEPYQKGKCFHKLFEEQVDRTPSAIAAIYDDGVEQTQYLTYVELDLKSNQLANYFVKQGVGREHIVGICIERSLDMVVALLAVQKAGAAYLPLDVSYPAQRLQYMIEDAGVKTLLSQSHIDLSLGNLAKQVNRQDLNTLDLKPYATKRPEVEVHPQQLAYLIYTSGSTGAPKGVLIGHDGLVNLTEDKIRVCNVRAGDCVLQFFSFSFDASVPEFIMSLAAGAKLLLSSAESIIPGPPLRRLIERHAVSHITMTPSALWSLPRAEYPELKMVLVGGEAPAPELIQEWGSSRTFINAYGPTETTVNASMVHCGKVPTGIKHEASTQVLPPNEVTPHLLPSANKHLYILDENLQLVPEGVPGELHISGVGLARGYLGRPALTAECFVPNPYATHKQSVEYQTLYKSGDLAYYAKGGHIKLLGRIDDQIKIRGYRIEIGEIEQALKKIRNIKTCVVVVVSALNRNNNSYTDGSDKNIVVYAVAENPQKRPTDIEIKESLKTSLPQFMLPAHIIWMDALPLTPNGKADTKSLPHPNTLEMENKQSKYVAPRNSIEEQLTDIFCDILTLKRIGVNDDFFDLGGHSLLATRLLSRCIEIFNVEITLMELFNGPSISRLAKTIDKIQKSASSDADESIGVTELQQKEVALDLRLCKSIQPGPKHEVAPVKNILLTGATGFVGSYLLRELLYQTDANIHCLIRLKADEDNNGLKRIQASMLQYGIWEKSF